MHATSYRVCRAPATRSLKQWRSITTNHFIHKETKPPTAEHRFTFAVKDNIATRDTPTTCASAFLQGYAPPFDATIVRQLRSRGGFLTGKTNMDEFGMGSHSAHSAHGPVLNPNFDVPRSAGGSSGGSAVAVRTGEADIAVGTDTGGSVRLPAAYTGVVGFKPSYGMVSRWGLVPYANSLDTVGFLARDVGRIYELVVGSGLIHEHDPNDPTSLSTESRKRCAEGRHPTETPIGEQLKKRQITIGIPQEYCIAELHPSIRKAWAEAETALREWGARIVPVCLPTTRDALPAYYILAPAEASSNLAKYDGVRYGTRPTTDTDGDGEVLYAETRGAGFGDEVKRRILLGTYSLSSGAMANYFIQAQKIRRLVQRDFDRVFARANPLREEQAFDLSEMGDEVGMEDKRGPPQVDFLLCPTAPTFPPLLEEVRGESPVDAYMNDVFTVPASLAGLPAVSVPVPVPVGDATKDTGPVAGLQVIGQFWDDARVLALAGELSKLMPVKV